MQPKIVPLPTACHVIDGLRAAGDFDVLAVEHREFPDGESYVRLEEDIEGADIAVAASFHPPNAAIVDSFLAAETTRDLGARSVGLVAPYLAYLRQDDRFREGEGVTSRYVAKLLSEHFDWIATVDPHLHRLDSLDEIYAIPNLAIPSAPAIGDWLVDNVDRPLLIGPDDESEQWVASVAEVADAPHHILEKERLGDRRVEIDMEALPEGDHHTPVVMDDIISSGGTMIEAVKRLRERGLRSPVCIGIHGLFAENAFEELERAGAERIVTTNTVRHHSNGIDVTELMAEALRSYSHNVSRSSQ